MRRVATAAKAFAAITVLVAASSAAWAQDGGKARPCTSPEYSQFDFWIGNWQVTGADGKQQGTNRVVKILGGCVIQENWNGGAGSIGQSFNIFAKGRGVWHQTWVDNSGTLLSLEGGIEDGRMVLRGETPARDGKGMLMHEISWTPLETGQVRQHWRISKDGGGQWQDAFVGIYTRARD